MSERRLIDVTDAIHRDNDVIRAVMAAMAATIQEAMREGLIRDGDVARP